MKLRGSFYKKAPNKKRLNFSAILNKDYFSKNIVKIRLALNNKRMVPLDYNIRRTKSKIDSGSSLNKKKLKEYELNASYKDKVDKENIPQELEKILEENEKKFLVQNKEYLNLKEKNNKGLGFWHYIQKMENNKKDILIKKYFDNNEDNNMINLHSDEIEKMSESIFKLNPLLITKEKVDIFFYYLGKFNKYFFDKNKYEHTKKKVVSFLNNLKDFLDYVAIKSDKNIDSIEKQIKLKNSKFLKELNDKIKAELENMEKKQSLIDEQEIKVSKNIIRKTRKTLRTISKYKNFFEDPVYFDPNNSNKEKKNNEIKSRNKLMNKNNLNTSAPNFMRNNKTYRLNKTEKMSTTSTWFLNEKINEKNNKIIPKIENSKIKDNLNFKNKHNLTSERKISLDNPNEQMILKTKFIKSNTISRNKNIEKEEIKKSTELNSASSSFYNNNLELNRTRKNFYRKNYQIEKININALKPPSEEYKDLMVSPEIEENINDDKSEPVPIKKINKTLMKKKTFNNIRSDHMFKFRNQDNSDLNIRTKEKKEKTLGAFYNPITKKLRKRTDSDNNEKYKIKKNFQINTLYENIKFKPKLNYYELNDINSYFMQKEKKIKANYKLMDIISKAKHSLLKYDIEQKTKKVSQSNLTMEQTSKLKDLKEINNHIEFLDVHYISSFIDFKSKTLCDDNLIKA